MAQVYDALLCAVKPTHRFLIALLPGPSLSAEVMRIREALHARIGHFSGREVPPHITLCLADLQEESGHAVVEAITRGMNGLRPIDLRLEGITHFPDRRTIYIDPVEKAAIAQVREPIADALREVPAIVGGLLVTDHPHLTIAAGLKPDAFMEAWHMLAPHRFTATERISAVTLLYRPLQPGGVYTVHSVFPMS